MDLTNDDIQDIVRLLDASFANELRLKTDRFELTLRRAHAGWTQEQQTLATPTLAGDSSTAAAAPAPAAPVEEPPDASIAVRAPMVGTFYRAPKPGAAPFVETGAAVGADTVIGIVETMKLMNAVCAAAAGTVTDICVADGQFVEAGQVLMRLAGP